MVVSQMFSCRQVCIYEWMHEWMDGWIQAKQSTYLPTIETVRGKQIWSRGNQRLGLGIDLSLFKQGI